MGIRRKLLWLKNLNLCDLDNVTTIAHFVFLTQQHTSLLRPLTLHSRMEEKVMQAGSRASLNQACKVSLVSLNFVSLKHEGLVYISGKISTWTRHFTRLYLINWMRPRRLNAEHQQASRRSKLAKLTQDIVTHVFTVRIRLNFSGWSLLNCVRK